MVMPRALSAPGLDVLLVPGHHACPGPRSASSWGCWDSGGGVSVLTYEDVGPLCFGDVGISTAFFLVASCVPENVAF